MDFQKQLEHTKKYAEAFWQHEMIDRPYVCVTAPLRPCPFPYSPALSYKACMSGRYDDILEPFLTHVDATYWGGESLPHIDLTLGPDAYAGFLGGTIETSSEDYTTWVKPCLDTLEGFEPRIDHTPGGYYDRLQRYLTYASKKCEGRFLINMMDLHSNMDAISALYSPTELCCELLEDPEEVHRVLDAVNDTYDEVFHMSYQICSLGGKIGCIGWQPVYCEGPTATLQCDFSCVIGPEHGREFVFTSIEREASYMKNAVYHLDGPGALCHLDTILSMDCIDCVQWVPGAGQPRSLEWMDVLHKIQAAGKAVWIFDWSLDEIKQHHKELEPDKVVYTLNASSQDAADGLLDYLVKNT